jgi:hypothetical protein
VTRLEWRAADGAVTVSSQRLLPGESAWVYEVSRLAHPSETFAKTDDVVVRNDAIKDAAVAFRDAVKKALVLKDEEIHWRAPGQLLIWGTKATHRAAGELFAALANPNATVAGDLAALHELTRKRFVANEEGVAKFMEARAQRRIVEALQSFSWRLLAGAAAREVDLEALTELQAAWRAPQMAAVLKVAGAPLPARSAFAITQAAKMLPQNEELAALAKQIVPLLRERAPELVKAAEESPAFTPAALYAALALGDANLAKRTQAAYASSPVAAIADGLLGATAQPRALSELLAQPHALTTEDWVLLAALACRRSGGETWAAWRAQAANIMGSRLLPGGVVVVVNRIGANPLPIAR